MCVDVWCIWTLHVLITYNISVTVAVIISMIMVDVVTDQYVQPHVGHWVMLHAQLLGSCALCAHLQRTHAHDVCPLLHRRVLPTHHNHCLLLLHCCYYYYIMSVIYANSYLWLQCPHNCTSHVTNDLSPNESPLHPLATTNTTFVVINNNNVMYVVM